MSGPGGGRMARILVVDDQTFVRDAMLRCMEEDGHQVEGAASGESALLLTEAMIFELLVTDIVMPGLDGFGLMRRIRRRFPLTKIIVISGIVSIDGLPMRQAALRLGAVDALV